MQQYNAGKNIVRWNYWQLQHMLKIIYVSKEVLTINPTRVELKGKPLWIEAYRGGLERRSMINMNI